MCRVVIDMVVPEKNEKRFELFRCERLIGFYGRTYVRVFFCVGAYAKIGKCIYAIRIFFTICAYDAYIRTDARTFCVSTYTVPLKSVYVREK